MKIRKFRITNYKGINDTTIHLAGNKGTIYTLVGLNESGKTTILEAINSFRPDVDGIHAIAQKNFSTDPIEALVPKKNKHNFNGVISVTATVIIEPNEITEIADYCKTAHGFQINENTFQREFEVTRRHTFKNSAHDDSETIWDLDPEIKKKRGKKFSSPGDDTDEWQTIVRELGKYFPRIIYFPTFLFDFPGKIKISSDDADFDGNQYFKRMIEDALASLDDPLNLETHIVNRILEKDPEIPFSKWFSAWFGSDEREQVTTALRKLSQKISSEIFGRWKEVLGSDVGNKEISIEHLVETSETGEREVYLTFKIKDGYSEYKVSERSLGFRWFFCFLLFTRFFRGNHTGESIFLFDEPASNLHSKAQSKLLDSLNVISSGKNDIIYSTHSHHLINPIWLETTFITTNGEPSSGEVVDINIGVEDTDVRVQLYKTFVGQYPEQGHYFQPILDRLEVAPSALEATREGVFTEGKSDFYILNWYKKYHNPSLGIDFVPIGGANNAKPLMALYLGLAVGFVFLLDSDEKGVNAKKDYLDKLPLRDEQIMCLGEVLIGKKEIEDLLGEKMKKHIAARFGVKAVGKKHILRAFSEALSGPNELPNDAETLRNVGDLATALRERLDRLSRSQVERTGSE